jgi:hypothetical protein
MALEARSANGSGRLRSVEGAKIWLDTAIHPHLARLVQ